jgi:hypothetical protein
MDRFVTVSRLLFATKSTKPIDGGPNRTVVRDVFLAKGLISASEIDQRP